MKHIKAGLLASLSTFIIVGFIINLILYPLIVLKLISCACVIGIFIGLYLEFLAELSK